MKRILISPIWFLLSGTLMAASIVFIALGGLRLGIDFTGGSILQLSFSGDRPELSSIEQIVAATLGQEAQIQPSNDKGVFIRTAELTPAQHEQLGVELEATFGSYTEETFSSVGPTIGQELKEKALVAILAVLIAIILYVSWAFREVSKGPVSSWVYGLSAIIALIHDVLLTTGLFAVLGYFANIQIDILFVTALLTVLGFSVHDTIVVFDRIRERIRLHHDESLENTIEESIRSTAARSLNTSLTTFLVLVALLLFGGESIRWFLVALIAGITFGTYSSIFVASQLLLVFRNAFARR